MHNPLPAYDDVYIVGIVCGDMEYKSPPKNFKKSVAMKCHISPVLNLAGNDEDEWIKGVRNFLTKVNEIKIEEGLNG